MKRYLSRTLLLLFVLGPVVATSAQDTSMASIDASTWTVDKAHSAINFTVKHFFTPVNGTFNAYDIVLVFDEENLDASQIDVTIDVSSIDTRNDRRNNHLKSGDFFDAEQYPTITFSSERIERTGADSFVAHGKLTIRDVTSDFELPFTLLGVKEFEGQMAQRMGSAVASFAAETSLIRHDYGVGSGSWATNAVVGDRVDIDITIEAGLK